MTCDTRGRVSGRRIIAARRRYPPATSAESQPADGNDQVLRDLLQSRSIVSIRRANPWASSRDEAARSVRLEAGSTDRRSEVLKLEQCEARGERSRSYILRPARVVDITQAPRNFTARATKRCSRVLPEARSMSRSFRDLRAEYVQVSLGRGS